MKKINPISKRPFKRGDLREDGYRFWAYRTSDKNTDGFFRMTFLSPEKWKEAKLKQQQRMALIQEESRQKILERRAIKETKRDGQPWKFGDFNDGMYFATYSANQISKGQQSGVWLTPNAWHKRNVRSTRQRTKDRAKKQNINWDLSTEYLLSIYPTDNKCPVLGIDLVWAGERENSPSLDKLIPNIGYVEGNVFWISWRANMIKSVGTAEEHRLVANWIDEQTKNGLPTSN